ncbi:hypothetical protein GCM10009678_72190 [Actinomadura kijaniata]|uniref:Uncharacterized protein n=1 Tax=Actinomadura namibiensis TaxID=182080 RepID=A0A7W3LYJ7_ACTNM|nr:hypothetical protein [Actinomadura namibiensis]MBA8956597.1 hypothetical protein [Actinomadura namibiensis]
MELVGKPTLVVEMRPGMAARSTARGLLSVAGLDMASLNDLCAAYGGSMRPLSGMSKEWLLRLTATLPPSADSLDLSRYYRVAVPVDQMEETAAVLRANPLMEDVYVQLPGQPGVWRKISPTGVEPPAAIPDFISRQGYLGPVPGGFDVRRAWELPGGCGAEVQIVHIDAAWQFTHKDLTGNQGGVLRPGRWRNHDTAAALGHGEDPRRARQGPDLETSGAGAAKNIDDRLTGLEQAMARLAHFIGTELRPDLSASALFDEDQPVGVTGTLADQLRHRAQQPKDTKDIETPWSAG